MKAKELAVVTDLSAYRPAGATSPMVIIVAKGKRATPCHHVDIVPAATTGDEPTFAVITIEEEGFCIPEECEFTYIERVLLSDLRDTISVLSAGESPTKPMLWSLKIASLAPSSLRDDLFQSPKTLRHADIGLVENQGPFLPSLNGMPEHQQRLSESQISSMMSSFASYAGAGGEKNTFVGPSVNSTGGRFPAQLKFWSATYARCEIILFGSTNRVFNGEGGGASGGGAYSGYIYPSETIEKLLTNTATCQIVSALFYVNISFWDAQSGYLGMMHGGGAGVGGGLFAGRWR